ncbi:MAG: methylenetetrahydrofolate reductase [Gammaproteobacteria bacterium]|jgi:methylenetetrahydrofolate reductase (NADPH)
MHAPIAAEARLGIEIDPAAGASWPQLAALNPDYLAIPDLGDQRTPDALVGARDLSPPLLLHLAGARHEPADFDALLNLARKQGVGALLPLRGDDPPSAGKSAFATGLAVLAYCRQHAAELPCWAPAYPETHPLATSRRADLEALHAKLDAGAAGVITQFAFDTRPLLRLRDHLASRGVSVPLLVGLLMPSDWQVVAALVRRSGVTVPDILRRQFERHAGDSASTRAMALEWACGFRARLVAEEMHGLHLFMADDAQAVSDLLQATGRPGRTG